MRKFTRFITPLLSLLLFLTSLAGNANAALQAVGPTDLITTIPSWYQDTNNLALMPCLDQNGFCILPPPFDTLTVPTTPITTTGPINNGNFPAEAFYYSADTTMNIEGGAGQPVGDRARLTFVLEYAFLGGVIPSTGTTFLRTDLQKMTNLSPNSTYRVTHPYGTFEFTTDGAGATTGGGGVAVRQEDGTGVAADYLPPLMKAAPSTNIGPFLTPASGIFPTAVVGGATHTYIGDAISSVAVTGSPTGNNFFRVERLTAGGGVAATWQINTFILAGRVFTGQIPSPMTIDRVTYARDAASEQVDIFATALPTAILNLSGTGITATNLTQDIAPNTTKFFTHIPLASTTLPTGLNLTNSLDVPPINYPITLVDEVIISQAFYNPVNRTVTIKAASRDKLAPLPTLTVPQFAAPNTLDATGTLVKTLAVNAIPPMTVTVNSSKLGTATAFVSVVTPPAAPVAVSDTASTIMNSAVLINVLANDTTAGTLDLASVVTSAAVGGTAVANTNGTVTFTPTTGFAGAASFTYTVNDTFGQTSNPVSVAVTVSQPIPASMISPANASTLAGASQAFTWSSAGANAYQIWAGTTLGSSNISVVNATTTTATVTGLPTNGSKIFIRLWSRFGTTWMFNDYSYTASGIPVAPVAAVMATPANAATLAGASQAFTWNNAGATSYQIWAGTSIGTSNIGTVNSTTTSATMTGLPTNGSTVFIRLWSRFGTTWLSNDYTYTASGTPVTPVAATMITPVNASVLTGASQTLTWSNTGADAYQIWLGSTAGTSNLNVVNATTTSATVTGFPANGTPVFVRLWSRFGTTWLFNSYTYTSNP